MGEQSHRAAAMSEEEIFHQVDVFIRTHYGYSRTAEFLRRLGKVRAPAFLGHNIPRRLDRGLEFTPEEMECFIAAHNAMHRRTFLRGAVAALSGATMAGGVNYRRKHAHNMNQGEEIASYGAIASGTTGLMVVSNLGKGERAFADSGRTDALAAAAREGIKTFAQQCYECLDPLLEELAGELKGKTGRETLHVRGR